MLVSWINETMEDAKAVYFGLQDFSALPEQLGTSTLHMTDPYFTSTLDHFLFTQPQS